MVVAAYERGGGDGGHPPQERGEGVTLHNYLQD